MPPGFSYHPAILTGAGQEELLREVESLDFGPVVMHGRPAKRRVVHFGWLYGYESWKIEPGPEPPGFLLRLRDVVSGLAGLPAGRFEEVLVTEYPAGAGIGWHADAPMFGTVIGVSLRSACRFKMRKMKDHSEVAAYMLEPGSAYILQGAARTQWQHSIPAARELRYSITYRTLRKG